MVMVAYLLRHHLDTTLIFQSAKERTSRYARNRSALTNWEESALSQLDLGKDKYGGPFTEEDIEDVKWC